MSLRRALARPQKSYTEGGSRTRKSDGLSIVCLPVAPLRPAKLLTPKNHSFAVIPLSQARQRNRTALTGFAAPRLKSTRPDVHKRTESFELSTSGVEDPRSRRLSYARKLMRMAGFEPATTGF